MKLYYLKQNILLNLYFIIKRSLTQKKFKFNDLILNIKILFNSHFNKKVKTKIQIHNDYIKSNAKKYVILKSYKDFEKLF